MRGASGADLAALERAVAVPADPGRFSAAEVAGLPDPVRRFFLASLEPGVPLARAARLEMRGQIRLGPRWLPFRAREVLAPLTGFVWPASVLGVLRGSDRCVEGEGAMDWRLAGRTVIRADGPDVSRSAAGRGAAEGMWVPTALLPRFDVEWRAEDASHVVAAYSVGGEHIENHLYLAADGRLVRSCFDRWGDPDETGTWRPVPFGADVLGWRTFDGVTIAASGRVGWWYGTPRFWDGGEFFRYEITALDLVR